MSANRERLVAALTPLVGREAIPGVLNRLDTLLVDQAQGRVKGAGGGPRRRAGRLTTVEGRCPTGCRR